MCAYHYVLDAQTTSVERKLTVLIVAHRVLQKDSGVTNMTKLSDTNGTCYALAISQGSDLLIVNPASLEIQNTIPFKNTIKILSAFGPNTLFVLLKNYSWFVIEIPKIKRYGEFAPVSTIIATRKILPKSSPYEFRSVSTSIKETQSLRFKENQFAYASHPHFIVVSIISGLLHVIPVRGNPFTIPVHYNNIVDLAFFGPTSSSARLALLADTERDQRILFVGRLTPTSLEEEFSELLPSDAYAIVPLRQENSSTVVVLTSDGIHRITAPIDIPQIHEHLPTFVSTISISTTPFEEDRYLLLDAKGGICAAEFPLEGRPRVEYLTNTNSIGGSIIYTNNSLVVSSPYSDTISYKFEVGSRGVKIEEQARLKAPGPIRKIIGDNQLYFLADRICALQESIECQKIISMKVGPCIGIFSGDGLICLSYLNESLLIRIFNEKVIKANEEYFISNEGTIAFGEYKDEVVQVTVTNISILGRKNIKLDLNIESASVFSDLILVSENDILHIFDSELNDIKQIKIDDRITMCTADENSIALIAHKTLIIIDRSNYVSVHKTKIHDHFTPSSIAVKNGIVYIGTENGRLIEINNGRSKINEVGTSAVNLHSSSNYVIGSGNPPFAFFNSHFLIDHTEYKDIVLLSDAFVGLLPDGTIEIMEEKERIGGPSKSVTSPPLSNFCIFDNSFIYQDSSTSLKKVVDGETISEIQTEARILFMMKLDIEDEIVIGTSNKEIIIFDKNLNKLFASKAASIPLCATEIDGKIAVANTETIEIFEYSKSELEKRIVISGNSLTSCLCTIKGNLVVGDREGSITIYKIEESNANEIASDHSGVGVSKVLSLDDLLFISDFDGNVQLFKFDDSLTLIGRIALNSRVVSMSLFRGYVVYGTEGGGIGLFQRIEDEEFGNQLKRYSKAIDEEGLCFVADRIAEGYETRYQDNILDIDNIITACTIPDLAKKIGIDLPRIKELLDQ